jgi:hypothetical protein
MKTEAEKIQKLANSFARKNGCGRATEVIIDPKITIPEIRETVSYGWRKYTTGEYVPNKYRSNFGWKNTYYQHAVCVVAMPGFVGNP